MAEKEKPDDLSDVFGEDAGKGQQEAPANITIETVAQKAARTTQLKRRINFLQELIDEMAGEIRVIEERELPEYMRLLRLASFKMDDGGVFEIKDVYVASVKVDDRPAAFQWLRDHNGDAIIKKQVVFDLGKVDSSLVKRFTEAVQKLADKNKIEGQALFKEEVHHTTLRAFVTQELKAGNPNKMPLDLFGAQMFQRAQYKPPKGD